MKKMRLIILSIILVLSVASMTGCEKENNGNLDTTTLVMNK